MTEPELVYEEHAQGCAEDDFWRQVRRTVAGQPVGEDQIDMIVVQMRRLLAIDPHDRFLDLCCGNGALTARVFEGCEGGAGVDIAPTLIAVARKHFDVDGVEYVEQDAVGFAESAPDPNGYDKAMIYGSINFFPREQVERLLGVVRARFSSVARLVVGNVADLERLHDFFGPDDYVDGIEDDPGSPIGVWWSQDQFRELAAASGWSVEFHRMPETFYGSHYRYDAVFGPR